MGILQASLEPDAGGEGAAAHIGRGRHALPSGCACRFALLRSAPAPVSTVRNYKSRLSYSRIDNLVRDPVVTPKVDTITANVTPRQSHERRSARAKRGRALHPWVSWLTMPVSSTNATPRERVREYTSRHGWRKPQYQEGRYDHPHR